MKALKNGAPKAGSGSAALQDPSLKKPMRAARAVGSTRSAAALKNARVSEQGRAPALRPSGGVRMGQGTWKGETHGKRPLRPTQRLNLDKLFKLSSDHRCCAATPDDPDHCVIKIQPQYNIITSSRLGVFGAQAGAGLRVAPLIVLFLFQWFVLYRGLRATS